ncbi:MAG TPA: hypothetical protein VI452_06175 [Marmoricola sp.]
MKIDPWPSADDSAVDEPLASLLRAAAPTPRPGPLPGEEDALAEFRTADHDAGRPSMQTTRTRARIVVAVTATAGMLTCAGAAAATTGTLPGAAQQTARDVLAKVGVAVPGPNPHSDGHADTRGKSAASHAAETRGKFSTAHATTEQKKSSTDSAGHGKGAEISELARTTTATGVDKGAQISTLASGGKSQAGEHGKPTDPGWNGTTHKPTDPGSNGTTHKPTDPGSNGTTHKPTDPGSKGTTHKPAGAGSTGAAASGSHRP